MQYPTLEFRVCDVCTRVDEAVCIAAIFQAIIAKLWKLRRDNMTFRVYRRVDRGEQVARGALRARRTSSSTSARGRNSRRASWSRELIAWFVDDVVDELGSRREVEYAFQILDDGTSADRQLAVCERTDDLKAVVDSLIAETAEGLA